MYAMKILAFNIFFLPLFIFFLYDIIHNHTFALLIFINFARFMGKLCYYQNHQFIIRLRQEQNCVCVYTLFSISNEIIFTHKSTSCCSQRLEKAIIIILQNQEIFLTFETLLILIFCARFYYFFGGTFTWFQIKMPLRFHHQQNLFCFSKTIKFM